MNPKSFSDDDLKRLIQADCPNEMCVFEKHFSAFVSRLEAAEAIVAVAPKHLNSVLDDLLEAWRKAAGK